MAHGRHGVGLGSVFIIALLAFLSIAFFSAAAKARAAEKEKANNPG